MFLENLINTFSAQAKVVEQESKSVEQMGVTLQALHSLNSYRDDDDSFDKSDGVEEFETFFDEQKQMGGGRGRDEAANEPTNLDYVCEKKRKLIDANEAGNDFKVEAFGEGEDNELYVQAK